MSDPTGSTTFSYERRGLLAQESQTINGVAYNQAYTYDANGNRITMTYPSGEVLSYGYDFADRPISVVRTAAGSTAHAHASSVRRSTSFMRGFVSGSSTNEAVQSESRVSLAEPESRPTPFSLRSPWEASRASGGNAISGIPVAPGVVRPIVQPPAVFEPSGNIAESSGQA